MMQQEASITPSVPPTSMTEDSMMPPVWGQRLIAGVVFVSCAAVLVIASLLKPSASGMGTHEQMGLPACGFKTMCGLPCATCGYTTAFACAARGELLAAMRVQPAGAFFAVLTAAGALVSGWAMFTGASLEPIARWLWRPRTIILVGVLVLGAWVYKIFLVTRVLA